MIHVTLEMESADSTSLATLPDLEVAASLATAVFEAVDAVAVPGLDWYLLADAGGDEVYVWTRGGWQRS